MSVLGDAIAKAKAELAAAESVPVAVEVGGTLFEIGVRPVSGVQWSDVVAANPPRKGASTDVYAGFNLRGAVADYPVEALTLDGEPVSAEDWAELQSALTAPSLENLAAVIYRLNQVEPAQRLVAAGKALKGQPVS